MIITQMIKICILIVALLFILLVFDSFWVLICTLFPKAAGANEKGLLFMKYDIIAISALICLAMFLNILRNGVSL